MTTAPGLTMSRRISSARPAAATRISASRVTAPRSGVRLCVTVTVASPPLPVRSSSRASGRPTMFERPTITTRLPAGSYPLCSSSSTMPAGVQGASTSRSPEARRPMFMGWNASTSFAGSIRSSTSPARICLGSGSWTRMPWISGSAFRPSTTPISRSCEESPGSTMLREWKPAASAARPFIRTYTWLAGSSPTRTVARPGFVPVCCSKRTASSAISARIALLSSVPLRIFAIPSPIGKPRASTREVDRACLPDHDDLDLPRILELLLEPPRDGLGQPGHPGVVDQLGLDDDAHLAARLDREAALDAREALRDLLQLLEALHVRLEHLAARTRPRAADRVRRRDEERLRVAVRLLVVVRADRVQDLVRLVVLLAELVAELDVRALVLVRQALADVVQQAHALGHLHVQPHLGRHVAR